MSDLLPEKWMKAMAATTTVLAVVAAIAGSRSAFFIAKAQLLTALEGSQWSYYQAKSIKQNLLEMQQQDLQISLLGDIKAGQKQLINTGIQAAAADIKRYDIEKAEIRQQAEATNKENTLVVRRGSQFSMAVVFAQIAIMLSSVGALLKRRELWIIGILIGAISLVFLANGFLLFL